MVRYLASSHYAYYRKLGHWRGWLLDRAKYLKKDDLVSQYGKALRQEFEWNLDDQLDDTPVDSFLETTADELRKFEKLIFDEKLLSSTNSSSFNPASEPTLLEQQEQARLWGRLWAQDALITGLARISEPHLPTLYQTLQCLCAGPTMHSPSFLLRRATEHELIFELLHCPHNRISAAKEVQNKSCEWEAQIMYGFWEAMCPRYFYSRKRENGICVDSISR